MRLMRCSVGLMLMMSLPVLAQDRLDALTKRIEELEKQQEELLLQSTSDSDKPVSSFLSDKLNFGGFFEPAYTVISGPDTELQSLNSSNILGLNIAAEYSPRLHFVSQFITALAFQMANEHNNPNAGGGQPTKREFTSPVFGAVLTQGYLEYSIDRNYKIQGGLGYVPFGYAFQQREPVLFIRRNGPQVLRTTEIVAPLWSGLNFLARFPLEKSVWGYNLYTFSPIGSPKHPGIGARTYWNSAEDTYSAGFSTQIGKIGTENYETFGVDFRYNLSPFLITTEYIYGFFEEEEPWSVYLEPAIYIFEEEVLLYVFGDYSHNSRNRNGGTGATSFKDPIEEWEYGFGVNWLPTAFTRIRVGLTLHDYVGDDAVVDGQDRDYTSLDLSAGVAF